MKRLLFTFSLFCSLGLLNAQEMLTLPECLRMGIDKNLTLKSQRNEMRKSKYGISENRAKLLPQINAIANMSDNFEPPVSVTDGSAYGSPYNVTHTLQYNASAGLQLQMPLYNQTVYTSVALARLMDEANTLSQPFYAVLGADLRLSFEWFDLFARGENLTGTDYNVFYFKSVGNSFFQTGKPARFTVGVSLDI